MTNSGSPTAGAPWRAPRPWRTSTSRTGLGWKSNPARLAECPSAWNRCHPTSGPPRERPGPRRRARSRSHRQVLDYRARLCLPPYRPHNRIYLIDEKFPGGGKTQVGLLVYQHVGLQVYQHVRGGGKTRRVAARMFFFTAPLHFFGWPGRFHVVPGGRPRVFL